MFPGVDKNDVAYARKFDVTAGIPAPQTKNGKINPHVSLFLQRDGRFLSVFHVKPVYYETTHGTWLPLSEICSHHGNKHIIIRDWWKVTPRYLDWLEKRQLLLGGTLLLETPLGNVRSTFLPRLSAGLAVTAVYPDPNPESTTVDGRVVNEDVADWNTCRNASSGNTVGDSDTSTTAPYSGKPLGANFNISRFFTLFDTSSIDDAHTISAATYSLHFTSMNNGDNDGEDYLSVVTTSPASNTSLALEDYDQVGSTEQHDSGQRKDISSIVTGGYTDWTLNATGLGNISKTGVTKFGSREGHDITGNAYAGASSTLNGGGVICADTSGTSSDPKLAVTHAAAVATIRLLASLGAGS